MTHLKLIKYGVVITSAFITITTCSVVNASDKKFGDELYATDTEILIEAIRTTKAEAAKKSNEFSEQMRIRDENLRSNCTVSKINRRRVLEIIGKYGRSNPASVKLTEVAVVDSLFGKRCIARFYHDRGICDSAISFDSSGSPSNVGDCE
jgi:hypothetical protein